MLSVFTFRLVYWPEYGSSNFLQKSQITNKHIGIAKETVIFTSIDVETSNIPPLSVFPHHTYPKFHAILIHEYVLGKVTTLNFNKVHT